jgi:hypothetical protein
MQQSKNDFHNGNIDDKKLFIERKTKIYNKTIQLEKQIDSPTKLVHQQTTLYERKRIKNLFNYKKILRKKK